MRCCYYPIKSEQGAVLLWVLFLLLFMAMSSITLARMSLGQSSLVQFYDQSFNEAREFRALERLVSEELKRHYDQDSLPGCFDRFDELTKCTFDGASFQKTDIRGRLLIEKEVEDFGLSVTSSSTDSKKDKLWLLLELKGLSQPHTKHHLLVYQLDHESDDINSSKIRRLLLWPLS